MAGTSREQGASHPAHTPGGSLCGGRHPRTRRPSHRTGRHPVRHPQERGPRTSWDARGHCLEPHASNRAGAAYEERCGVWFPASTPSHVAARCPPFWEPTGP